MSTVSMRSKQPSRKSPAPQQPPTEPAAQKDHPLPVPPCDDLHILIAKRAHELYGERGYGHGSALDDWLDAEREILGQIPPV